MPIHLTGITWSHSRGYPPMVAVSQRYEELHPEIRITWEKRSLANFESQSIEELAQRYDMLVLDHPWTGRAVASQILIPLNELLPPDFLEDQKRNSIGPSYRSYTMQGQQIALAIDGAAPVAVYRQDLLEKAGGGVPETWEDVLSLAKGRGVIFAGGPVYTILDFFSLCATIAGGDEALYGEEELVPYAVGAEALERQRELAALCDPVLFEMNPIQVYEELSRADSPYLYSPFLFGYVNYFRPGYGERVLKAANVVSYHGTMLKTTLGGTGLAVSANAKNRKEIADFCQYVASEGIQRTLFFDAGGQPGYKTAWEDRWVNERSNGFFKDTADTLEHCSIRPRYNGYMDLQNQGGFIVQEYMKTGTDVKGALEKLNALYLKSRRGT